MTGFRDHRVARVSMCVYHRLLLMYPKDFREAYGAQMEQLWRDMWREAQPRGLRGGVWLWGHVLMDLALSSFGERYRAMRRTFWASLALAIGLGMSIAWIDTRPTWDDTGITVGLLLIVSGVFGLANPSRPWLWAIAVGIWLPIFNSLLYHNNSVWPVLTIAFVGAYAGTLAGKALEMVIRHGPTSHV